MVLLSLSDVILGQLMTAQIIDVLLAQSMCFLSLAS